MKKEVIEFQKRLGKSAVKGRYKATALLLAAGLVLGAQTAEGKQETGIEQSGTALKAEETGQLPQIYGMFKTNGLEENYYVYDFDELVIADIWQWTQGATLPVYEGYTGDTAAVEIPRIEDVPPLKENLLYAAEALGIKVKTENIQHNGLDGEGVRELEEKLAEKGWFNTEVLNVTYGDRNLRMRADNLYTSISFTGVNYRKETGRNKETTYIKIYKKAEGLKEEFADFLNAYMENPQISVRSRGRNLLGKISYDIYFYDAGTDGGETLINYWLNPIRLYSNGPNYSLVTANADFSNKLGDYPVISPDKAKEMLLQGAHTVALLDDFLEIPQENRVAFGEEDIKGMEVVYRDLMREENYMPYYKFYIDIHDDFWPAYNGLQVCRAYYVPAVEAEYIAEIKLIRNRFQ